MRVLNLLLLTFAMALTGSLGLCYVAEWLLGYEQARYIVIPFAFAWGLMARRVVERVIGYTLEEAMKMDRAS